MRAILLRIALFFLHSTALLALLPLVARGLPGGDAGTFTLLLASMGVGRDRRGAARCRASARLMPLQTLLLAGTVLQALARAGGGVRAEHLRRRAGDGRLRAWPGSRWPTR